MQPTDALADAHATIAAWQVSLSVANGRVRDLALLAERLEPEDRRGDAVCEPRGGKLPRATYALVAGAARERAGEDSEAAARFQRGTLNRDQRAAAPFAHDQAAMRHSPANLRSATVKMAPV